MAGRFFLYLRYSRTYSPALGEGLRLLRLSSWANRALMVAMLTQPLPEIICHGHRLACLTALSQPDLS